MGPHGAFGFGSARGMGRRGRVKVVALAKLEASLKKPQKGCTRRSLPLVAKSEISNVRPAFS
jgi:hypothetical protein